MADETVLLRTATTEDLPAFFEHQCDPDALRMAAFPVRTQPEFMAHWERILRDPGGMARTILAGGRVAGYLVCWEADGQRLVGYWLGREFWGQGIASRALAEFLRQEPARPLFAYVAKQNPASLRVLEKCGFHVIGENQATDGPAGEMVDEWFLALEASAAEAAV